MLFALLRYMRGKVIFNLRKHGYLSPIPEIEPISVVIRVLKNTTRYQCALDSGMHVIAIDRDEYTFSDVGDTSLLAEYYRYCRANKHAIQKEELAAYKY